MLYRLFCRLAIRCISQLPMVSRRITRLYMHDTRDRFYTCSHASSIVLASPGCLRMQLESALSSSSFGLLPVLISLVSLSGIWHSIHIEHKLEASTKYTKAVLVWNEFQCRYYRLSMFACLVPGFMEGVSRIEMYTFGFLRSIE